MRPAPAILVVLAAVAGCGGGSHTSAIPAGGGTGGATAPATATTAAPAGCAKVAKPKSHGVKLAKPTTKLDASKTYTATVTTNCGAFAFKLDVRDAPKATASIAYLASKGFYDHTIFHRIVPGFVIQGGDPSQSGQG